MKLTDEQRDIIMRTQNRQFLTEYVEELLEKHYVAQRQVCRGVLHPGCEYYAACGSICNKCGQLV